MQGAWSDAMNIQTVADQLKLKIIIIETHEGFSEYSIIQPASSIERLTNVYLGHIGKYHYVSTLPCSSIPGFCYNNELSSSTALNASNQSICNRRRKCDY